MSWHTPQVAYAQEHTNRNCVFRNCASSECHHYTCKLKSGWTASDICRGHMFKSVSSFLDHNLTRVSGHPLSEKMTGAWFWQSCDQFSKSTRFFEGRTFRQHRALIQMTCNDHWICPGFKHLCGISPLRNIEVFMRGYYIVEHSMQSSKPYWKFLRRSVVL